MKNIGRACIFMYIYIHVQGVECGVVISSTMSCMIGCFIKQKGDTIAHIGKV